MSTAVSFSADTMRTLTADINFSADVLRNLSADINFSADTVRALAIIVHSTTDTVRNIPNVLTTGQHGNVKSLAITLAEKTLSDNFRVELAGKEIALLDAMQGSILDFPYNFLANETTLQNGIQTVNGMYDVDQLLYTPFKYTVSAANLASEHAERIADALGKSLNIEMDDFTPSNNFSGVGATYQNILSGLFGWTSKLPQRQINVFIRGNTLNVIQRGKENSSIDISKTKHTRPVINRKLLRSVWSGNGNGNGGATGITVDPIPFTGTISYGDASVSYVAGLVMEETHKGETTTYSYSDGYPASKKTVNSDGSRTITTYDYANTGKGAFLASETEVTTDTSGNPSTKVTRHIAIGNGWYATTVENDGEYVGATLSQGKSSGKASKYTINQSNLALGGTFGDGGDGLNGSSLIDTEFPVVGVEFLRELTREIEWLNRKTQETITMDIYNHGHVVDFTEKIIFDGATYFLVSNNISRTPRELKQSVQLVRWY